MGKVLLDADGIDLTLAELAKRIEADVPAGVPIGFIGIRSRGDILVARLMQHLRNHAPAEVVTGALDITLYRDDLAHKGPLAVLQKTEINFDVDGRYLILVDDVLHTGRSARAGLDAIMDLGRPRAIRLAVLIARPGRELPIQADYVGVDLKQVTNTVRVKLRETSGTDLVEIE